MSKDTASREELDNDGYSEEWVRDFFRDKYPELSDLEMHILMNVHSKNSCATGIWCESELSDWVELIQAYTTQRLEAFKEAVEEALPGKIEYTGDEIMGIQIAISENDAKGWSFHNKEEIESFNRAIDQATSALSETLDRFIGGKDGR